VVTGFYDAKGEWTISNDGIGLSSFWIISGSPDSGASEWNLIKID